MVAQLDHMPPIRVEPQQAHASERPATMRFEGLAQYSHCKGSVISIKHGRSSMFYGLLATKHGSSARAADGF
jgi:hypothetical protein